MAVIYWGGTYQDGVSEIGSGLACGCGDGLGGGDGAGGRTPSEPDEVCEAHDFDAPGSTTGMWEPPVGWRDRTPPPDGLGVPDLLPTERGDGSALSFGYASGGGIGIHPLENW